MSASLTRLTLLACLALALPAPPRAHAAAPPRPRPVDRHGDPLPRGAVARLGTLRFVHLGGLASVAVSPDGKVVASGVTEGKKIDLGERVTPATVRLWDAGKGTLIRELTTPDAPVSCLRFAPDGRTLFAGCGRFVCAWDAGTGKKLWQKEGVSGEGFHYGVRAERLLLARDKLISLHGGTLTCRVPEDGGASYFYHPQVVVRLWDRVTGKPLPTPAGLRSTIEAEGHIATLFHDAAVSPDGRYAAVLSSRAAPLPRAEDGSPSEDSWKHTARRLVVVDLATGKVSHTIPGGKDVKARRFWVWDRVTSDALAFSADGDTLAAAAGGEVALVQTGSGRKRLLAKGLPEEPALAFVGSNQLAARPADGKVRAWEVATGKEVSAGPSHEHAFVSAHNGRIAAAAHGNTVRLTDLRTGKAVRSFEGHRLTPLVRFAFHSRGVLLSADGEGACLWEAGSWKQRGTMALPGKQSTSPYTLTPETLDEGVSWEKGLYVKERDGRFELRDIKADRLVRPLPEAAGARWVMFSASGDRLMVRTGDSYRFLDVGTGKVISQLGGSDVAWLRLSAPRMSPRGTYFVRYDKDDRVELREISSRKLLRPLGPKPNPKKDSRILWYHFSPDEKTLLGEVHQQVSFEKGFSHEKVSVLLWDVRSGEIFQEMVVDPQAHSFWRQAMSESRLSALALSHDRRLVALARTGGKDVEVWETASGTRRGVLSGHAGPVASLAFSADGKYLASGSEDTTVLVWDLRRPLRDAGLKGRLKGEELAAHWEALSRPEAEEADLAAWCLASAPRDAVPFLKERLRPVARPEGGRLKRLLADLGSDDFKTRSSAAAEIRRSGELALGELQREARGKHDLEKQRRLEALLRGARAAARPFGTTEKVRQWRALEVLERAATPEAVGLLRDLAGGAPGVQLTEEARAALARLGARTKPGR